MNAVLQVLVTVLISLSYLCVGLVRAWATTAVPSMTSREEEEEGEEPLTEDMISWVVATPPIGAITGSLLSGLFLDKLGRRLSILVSGLLFLTAFLSLGLARLATSTVMVRLVLVFRAVSGTAVGLAVPSVSIFIAETVSARHRGTLSCIPALQHAAGILLSYVAGAFLPWHLLSYLSCLPAVLLLATLSLLPETPAWLASRGRQEAAVRSYVWYRSVSQELARKEVEDLTAASKEPSDRPLSWLGELFSRSTLQPLTITLILQAVQNFCGVNVIVFKTVHVFQTFQTSIDNYLATAVVGGVQLLATFSKTSRDLDIGILTQSSSSVSLPDGQGRPASSLAGVRLDPHRLHELPGALPHLPPLHPQDLALAAPPPGHHHLHRLLRRVGHGAPQPDRRAAPREV